MTTVPSPRDLDFLLYEVLDTAALAARPRHGEYSREAFDAVIDTARQLAADHLAPHQKANDEHEPHVVDGKVVTIPEVARAFRAVADAGFIAATHDAELGGMQLPHTIATAALLNLDAANVATASYALLTTGAANLIAAHGSDDQKARFLAPMLAGRFTGTMALSEPDAGSSLADLRTRATPMDDGTFRITGTKMWISGGENEIAENIVHLVLARIDGAPPGVRGISLFVVPKRLVDDRGAVGATNGVVLGGLIHKMGWRGTTSTVLNFGERGPCTGYLVGRAHHGLACMFHMMNEARIGVGRAGAAMGYAAYRYSLEYARTRRQGRLPGEKDPTRPQVPIIEHPDVRRMLLQQKSVVEAAVHLTMLCARLVDDLETAADESVRREAGLLLEVLTPVAKSWPGEACQEAISNAMQILGGYGFAREYPIEQLYRDNRLNPIHEGTNGIQALDLLGRKVRQDDGAALTLLLARMGATVAAAREAVGGGTAGTSTNGGGTSLGAAHTLGTLADALEAAVARLAATTGALGEASATLPPARALANASVYLELASRTIVAWLWLQQATVAARALVAGTTGDDAEFYRGKLQAARYWFGWELPRTEAQAALLTRLDSTVYEMQVAWF